MSKESTFVFEGIEVKLTGRTADRVVKSAMAKPDATPKKFVLHEVTPVDSFAGDWKKWVRKEELYEVQDVPVATPAAPTAPTPYTGKSVSINKF